MWRQHWSPGSFQTDQTGQIYCFLHPLPLFPPPEISIKPTVNFPQTGQVTPAATSAQILVPYVGKVGKNKCHFLYLNTPLSLFWIIPNDPESGSICLLWHPSKFFVPFSHFSPSPRHELLFSKFSLLHLVPAEGFPAEKSNNHVPGTCCVYSWSITRVKLKTTLRTYRFFYCP